MIISAVMVVEFLSGAGSAYMARDILLHPTAKDKFKLDQCKTPDGRSPLHLVAEQGNAALWNLAVERPDCDLTSKDSEGNTPLMRAVISKRLKILEAWLINKEKAKIVDQSLKNKDGKTLVMLFVEHITQPQYLRMLLNTVDAKSCINATDKHGNTALIQASQMGKWAMAKELLSNHGLKIGPTEEELEGTIDLHPFDQDGLSALAIQVLARIKLARAEQTYIMKKQRVLAAEAKKEQDEIWELIKIMLVREKEQQGHSKANCVIGTEYIKEQFSVNKLIRPQCTDEVVQEFIKLYQFIKKKKPVVKEVEPKVSAPYGLLTPGLQTSTAPAKDTPSPATPTVATPLTDTFVTDTPDSPKLRKNSTRTEIMEKLKRLQEGVDADDILTESDKISAPDSPESTPASQPKSVPTPLKSDSGTPEKASKTVAESPKNVSTNSSIAPTASLSQTPAPAPVKSTSVTTVSNKTISAPVTSTPVTPTSVTSVPTTSKSMSSTSATPVTSSLQTSAPKSSTPVSSVTSTSSPITSTTSAPVSTKPSPTTPISVTSAPVSSLSTSKSGTVSTAPVSTSTPAKSGTVTSAPVSNTSATSSKLGTVISTTATTAPVTTPVTASVSVKPTPLPSMTTTSAKSTPVTSTSSNKGAAPISPENVPDSKKDVDNTKNKNDVVPNNATKNEENKLKENGAKFIPGRILKEEDDENSIFAPTPLAPARQKTKKKSSEFSTQSDVATQTDPIGGAGCKCCCTCNK